jgi:hypothetical protein
MKVSLDTACPPVFPDLLSLYEHLNVECVHRFFSRRLNFHQNQWRRTGPMMKKNRGVATGKTLETLQ